MFTVFGQVVGVFGLFVFLGFWALGFLGFGVFAFKGFWAFGFWVSQFLVCFSCVFVCF